LFLKISNIKKMNKYILIVCLAITFIACGVQKGNDNENFDHFYSKFHEDSIFQKARIDFPLSGETSYLSPTGTQMKLWYEEDWVTHQPYDALDTLGYEQNIILVDTMAVDVIYDNRAQGITRYFSLKDGQWYLTFYSDFNPVNPTFINTGNE